MPSQKREFIRFRLEFQDLGLVAEETAPRQARAGRPVNGIAVGVTSQRSGNNRRGYHRQHPRE